MNTFTHGGYTLLILNSVIPYKKKKGSNPNITLINIKYIGNQDDKAHFDGATPL